MSGCSWRLGRSAIDRPWIFFDAGPNREATPSEVWAGERIASLEQTLRSFEAELREQAIGSQDGYLLDVANRMREALRKFQAG